MSDFDSSETKKVRAVAALLQCSTVAEAAAQGGVGVSERTIYRWLEEPGFQQMLKEAEADLLEQTTRKLAGLLSKAVDRLESLIDSDESHSVRLKACQVVIDKFTSIKQVSDQEGRLAELERLVGYGTQKTFLKPVS